MVGIIREMVQIMPYARLTVRTSASAGQSIAPPKSTIRDIFQEDRLSRLGVRIYSAPQDCLKVGEFPTGAKTKGALSGYVAGKLKSFWQG